MASEQANRKPGSDAGRDEEAWGPRVRIRLVVGAGHDTLKGGSDADLVEGGTPAAPGENPCIRGSLMLGRVGRSGIFALDFPVRCRHIPRNFTNPFGGSSMKEFFTQFFTWWNGQTLGTRFFTWRKGQFVGEDEFGNLYYRYTQAQAIDSNVGAERRWVIYNGAADASKVPPGWRAWLCHNGDVPPSEESYQPHSWERPYVPNMTGTAQAYRPQGSSLSAGQRPAATGDYVPWTPGE